MDEFTRLKKLSHKKIAEIRKTISERDELISSSSGSGGKASVQLSSRVRELLREAHDTHAKMQARVAKEEKDLAKGKRNLPYTQEDLEMHKEITELVSKHIVECEVLCLSSCHTPAPTKPRSGQAHCSLDAPCHAMSQFLLMLTRNPLRMRNRTWSASDMQGGWEARAGLVQQRGAT